MASVHEHPVIRHVPNVLTTVRLFAVPALFVAMVHAGGASLVAGLIFFAAAFTDFFDGWIARRFRVTSQYGKVVDPIADRLLVNTAVVLLCWYDSRWAGVEDGRLLGIEFVVVIARDVLATYGYSRIRGRVIPDVTQLGKWGMAFMMAGLTWLLLLPAATWPVYPFWLGLAISVVVLGQYVRRYGGLAGHGYEREPDAADRQPRDDGAATRADEPAGM